MKVLLLLLATALATASAQSCNGHLDGTLLQDATRCNYFFSCHNGQRHELSCPSGFHFCATSSRCEPPSVAGCVRCPAEGFVNLAVAGGCRQFVQCFQGVATDRECTEGMAFDGTLGQCNLAQNVQC